MLQGFTEYVETKPGFVYLLYQFNELVYIGSTVSLRSRINEHRKSKQYRFNRVYYQQLALSEARKLEIELIREHKPILNIAGKAIVPVLTRPIDLAALGFDVSKYQQRD